MRNPQNATAPSSSRRRSGRTRAGGPPACVLLPAVHPLAGHAAISLHQLADQTWIRAHDGSAARHVDHLLAQGHLAPPLLLAGHGDEPIEAQALVAAGRGITIAYHLNVIINPAQIAVRELVGCASVRHIHAACLPGPHGPATQATIDALQQLRQHDRAGDPPGSAAPAGG